MNKHPQRLPDQIGDRLRQLRQAQRITLDGLAAKTGFSKGYLSKIENARKVPPIASLSRISQALGTDIAYFFQPAVAPPLDDRGVCLVRAEERQPAIRGGSSFGYDYESLAHKKMHKHMEPFVLTFPSHVNKDVHFEHDGEEFLFVLSGRVEFEVDGQTWRLSPGDSLYFDSTAPHRGRSIGEDAKALVVIFNPEDALEYKENE